ncbi:hypothetical protein HMPREF1861_00139 [Corynebacterium kroppenstedtii]|nr:hypothetical protein HMPREF1861_00139 [Corynebacterium kroppenstedtii]
MEHIQGDDLGSSALTYPSGPHPSRRSSHYCRRWPWRRRLR